MSDLGDGASIGDSAWAPRAPSPPPAPAAEGLLAGYRDFTVIARGGDSVVYRARQEDLDRDVAIKVVQLDDPDTVARFRRELDITVRLGRQHPHIVTVLAAGTTTGGQPCLVMDFCELGSLHDRLRAHGPLPTSEVVSAGSQVADALTFAHAQGVLHRDVKPQNILVLPTSYVLADFGLARAIDAGHTASLERFSYRHAAPQVLDGESPTVADDIYSLGSTLFTLLDGRAPFAAESSDEDTALAYLRRARTSAPRRLTRGDVPDALAAIVERCLAKDRADRFADAGDLRAALDSLPTETRNWAPGAPPAGPVPEAAAAEPEPAADRAPAESPSARPQAPSRDGEAPRHDVVPEPVAVSALAHLDRAPEQADGDEATGLRPEPPTPEPTHEPAPPRRWRWIAVGAICVAAVAVGLVFGLRTGDAKKHAAPPSPTPTTARATTVQASLVAPVPTAHLGSLTGSAAANDPSLAPKITSIRRDGIGVALAYTDPSDGKATFVVFLADASPTALTTVKPGVTKVVLDNLPGKHCLTVLAVLAHADGTTTYGRSKPACLT